MARSPACCCRDLAASSECGSDEELNLLRLILANDRASIPSDAAERAMAEFGTLAATLAASFHRQAKACGGAASAERLQAVRAAMIHALREPLTSSPVIGDSLALSDYLRADLGHDMVERVRVLHLDAANMLIRDEVVSDGTVDGAVLHVREIIARALELGTASLVVAHNHPSGDATPSASDVTATRAIVDAGRLLGIAVHDHVVVGRSGCSSMRAMGLL